MYERKTVAPLHKTERSIPKEPVTLDCSKSTKRLPVSLLYFFLIFQMPPCSSYLLPPGIKYQDIKWYIIILHTKSQSFYLCKTKVQLDFCLCTSSKIDLYSFISVIIWFLALAICILSCLNMVLQLDTQLHTKESANPPSITVWPT